MGETDTTRGGQRIVATHWSTDEIAPELRFETWVSRPWPSLALLFETVALEPFETRADHVVFGGVVVQFAEGTARRYHRSAKRAAIDAVDAIGISIPLSGHIKGKAGTRPFLATARTILLLDLKRPARFDFTRSTSIQMAVPRALAERHLGDLDNIHGLVVPVAQSALLLRHLSACRKALPVLTIAQGPLLAGVILDLLAVAIGRGGETTAAPATPLSSPARIAAERAIAARLGEAAVSAKEIGEAIQISRSSLYRLFEAEGGFGRYVKLQRLEQVRVALADANNRDPVAALAKRWGFKSASHLSRTFQATFGVSPTDYRRKSR